MVNVATVIVDGVEHTNLPLNPDGKLNEIQLNTKTLKNNSGTAFTTNIKLDNVKNRLLNIVGGRTNIHSLWSFKSSASGSTGNYSHSLSLFSL